MTPTPEPDWAGEPLVPDVCPDGKPGVPAAGACTRICSASIWMTAPSSMLCPAALGRTSTKFWVAVTLPELPCAVAPVCTVPIGLAAPKMLAAAPPPVALRMSTVTFAVAAAVEAIDTLVTSKAKSTSSVRIVPAAEAPAWLALITNGASGTALLPTDSKRAERGSVCDQGGRDPLIAPARPVHLPVGRGGVVLHRVGGELAAERRALRPGGRTGMHPLPQRLGRRLVLGVRIHPVGMPRRTRERLGGAAGEVGPDIRVGAETFLVAQRAAQTGLCRCHLPLEGVVTHLRAVR